MKNNKTPKYKELYEFFYSRQKQYNKCGALLENAKQDPAQNNFFQTKKTLRSLLEEIQRKIQQVKQPNGSQHSQPVQDLKNLAKSCQAMIEDIDARSQQFF